METDMEPNIEGSWCGELEAKLIFFSCLLLFEVEVAGDTERAKLGFRV